MSATFSSSRLLQLVRKQWIENARFYLLSALALIGILGLVLLFWFSESDNSFKEEDLYMIFTFGMYIAGGVFASTSFSMLGEKEKGTYWLSFPASHLEKLLCILLYNVILFTLVYCACFLLLKTVAFTYIQNLVKTDPLRYHLLYMERGINSSFSTVFPNFMYAFFAVQGFYVLGSVYFSRFSFVITTVVGAILIAGFMWYAFYLSKSMLPNNNYNWHGSYVARYTYVRTSSDTVRYELSGILSEVFWFIVKFIWAPVFWIVTWYRLKEKQI